MRYIDPNYFTCTLGEAARRKQGGIEPTHSFTTVLDVVDEQAKRLPDARALGFADFTSQTPNAAKETKRDPRVADPIRFSCPNVVTFQELSRLSIEASESLSKALALRDNPGQSKAGNIGLLCTSSVRFVATWLGLVRLGYSVLLLAPQLEPSAIQHLCDVLQINKIFADDRHSSRTESLHGIHILKVPSSPFLASPAKPTSTQNHPPVPDIALYFHTSGTSSGLPKPIPQTQHGLVGALSGFPRPEQGPAMTFSTTPLYHGGLPDCFRSWTSGAMIWFFPEGVAPMTTTTLIKAIGFVRRTMPSKVGYFSSVPYVVQMLAQEKAGLEVLKAMDLVGFGGAALPEKVGDELVRAGVNLLSRLGSAECGFLMSSHRDYANDGEWQYLRPSSDTKLLQFEPRADGLSELVVKPAWPFKVKSNRNDGSYATADLFEPHPSRPNLWRHHSRSDGQITLLNGKKFDPSPMEESLRASLPLLQDVFIFGDGREYPGAILFTTSNCFSSQDVVDSAWAQVNEMNNNTQSHARIARSMLLVVQQGQSKLAKSSKGTILRHQAEEQHAATIQSAYEEKTPCKHVATRDLPSTVLACFSKILGREIDPDRDLYLQGVDSMACILIRKLIESTCLPADEGQLPINVLYDQGTASALIRYLYRVRHEDGNECDDEKSESREMLELANKYSKFQPPTTPPRKKYGEVVVLTGATGFLGAHILHQLRQDDKVVKVYCLIRAPTSLAAQQRVSRALLKRGMPGLEVSKLSKLRKVVCLPCRLSNDTLGLTEEDRMRILEESTLFIHSAWTVNFSIRLSSFEDQIVGTKNLIDTAIEASAQFVFISSTAAVSSHPSSSSIPEKISSNPSDSSPLGYSQSKWVAESVCASANDALTRLGLIRNPITVIRVGQLCGNDAGIWNESEAYPLLLSTANIAQCLPQLPGEAINWTPVELAAKAVLEIVYPEPDLPLDGTVEHCRATPVYHLTNPHQSPTWDNLLRWIWDPAFLVVPYSVWITELEAVLKEDYPDHPSQALLGMWKKSVGQTAQPQPNFDVRLAQLSSPTLRKLEPLGRDRVVRMWNWIQRNLGHFVQFTEREVNGV